MYPHALMQGNPPSTASTWLLLVNFPLHPCSKLPFLTFSLFSIEQGEKSAYSMRALRSPTIPPLKPRPPPPSTSHLYLSKVSTMRKSRHFSSSRAAWGIFLLCFAKWTNLVLPSLFWGIGDQYGSRGSMLGSKRSMRRDSLGREKDWRSSKITTKSRARESLGVMCRNSGG